MKSKNYYWLLILFLVIFILWFFISKHENKPLRHLSYFEPKNTLKVTDTAHHSIPNFEFVNQYGETITEATVQNKIYVTEYFFTTCQSICPIMNQNLEKVYKTFHNYSDFLILSHTVDPETDSVSVLKDYAAMRGVYDKKWLFVTGNKKNLYDMARKGYLLNADEGKGDEDDFIHTQNFALIDKERHIRGFYDGTDSLEIIRLIQEINLLMKEYEHKKHS